MCNLSRVFILGFAFLFVVGVEVNAKAPESAREAAVKELASLAKQLGESKSYTVFGAQVTGSQLSEATLGTACVFLYDVDIDTLVTVDYWDLINLTDKPVYSYPVIHNGEPIGEIRVREKPTRSGNYEASGQPISQSIRRDRLFELQDTYPSQKGFAIAVIRTTKPYGWFYLVFKEDRPFLITPVGRFSRLLKIDRREDEIYPVIPVWEGVRQLKENYANRNFMPLEERLKWADLVIVGKISHVRPYLSIVIDDADTDYAPAPAQYDYGVITIYEVLMRKDHIVQDNWDSIGALFYSPARQEGKDWKLREGWPEINDGDEGIWFLKGGALIGIWVVYCGKCFLPLDMISQVVEAIGQQAEGNDDNSSSN